jgi:hypothetical protein
LREAIDERETAISALADTESAETRAFERLIHMENALEELREQHAKEPDQGVDAFISSMRDGGDCSVAELEATTLERAEQIAAGEREIAVLRRIREQIAERIPVASKAVADAKARVERRARIVLVEKLDVDRLMREHDAAFDALAVARARLGFAARIIPHPESAPIYLRLECTFRDEGRYADVRHDPACAGMVAAYERLQQDADAEIDKVVTS